VKRSVNTTFFYALVISILLTAFFILSGKWILRLTNTPQELLDIGWTYYRVIMLSLVFVFFNNVYIMIEKARGNGVKFLTVNILMAVSKVLLSGFFVLVLHQGVVMIADLAVSFTSYHIDRWYCYGACDDDQQWTDRHLCTACRIVSFKKRIWEGLV
jgi:O-antigen/teichoic acid export membrane protein